MVAIVVEGGDGRFERHHGEIEGGGRKLAMGDKRGVVQVDIDRDQRWTERNNIVCLY